MSIDRDSVFYVRLPLLPVFLSRSLSKRYFRIVLIKELSSAITKSFQFRDPVKYTITSPISTAAYRKSA